MLVAKCISHIPTPKPTGGPAETALTHLQAPPADSPRGPFGSVLCNQKNRVMYFQDCMVVFTIVSRFPAILAIWGSLYILHRQYELVNDLQMKEQPKRRVYQTDMVRTGSLTT